MTTELLLPVAFLAGFFGGGHCLGMCGPIVILFEGQRSPDPALPNLLRRIVYNAGRLLFYVLLGAAAGAAGLVLTRIAGIDTGLAVLRILAAMLVVALGLNLLFNLRMLRYLETSGAALWKRLSPLARHVFPIYSPGRALAAGALWGALPCGLVYSAVAIAATSGSAASGAAVMLAFWLGTLPALLVAGASAQKLSQWSRKPALRKLTGSTLILVGVFTLAMPYLRPGPDGGHAEHAQINGSTLTGRASPNAGTAAALPRLPNGRAGSAIDLR